jgi:hypothetical protein
MAVSVAPLSITEEKPRSEKSIFFALGDPGQLVVLRGDHQHCRSRIYGCHFARHCASFFCHFRGKRSGDSIRVLPILRNYYRRDDVDSRP